MKSAVIDTFPEPNRRLLQRFAHFSYFVFPFFRGYQDHNAFNVVMRLWLVADSW